MRDLPQDGVLLVVGFDWSSEIAYYGEHRAITVPNWVSPEQLEVIRSQPELIAGGLPIAAVIDCPGGLSGDSRCSSSVYAGSFEGRCLALAS